MTLAEMFSAELQQEAATTRRVLENLPDGTWDWKPHEKSMTLGRLAGHVAEIPQWMGSIVNDDQLAMTSGAGSAGLTATSKDELLKAFDANVAMAKGVLDGKTDDVFGKPWKFVMDGKVVIELPKAAVVRAWVLNHGVHHRGQLSVYLRLNDAPVPAIYGPSADEPAF